jgi:hypothetical protein
MSYDYDYTEINATNAPWHWVRLVKYLKGDLAPLDPAPADAAAQMAALDPSYLTILNYVEGIDIGDVHGATLPTISLASTSTSNRTVTFNVTDQDEDVNDVLVSLNGGAYSSTGLTKFVNTKWTSAALAAGSTTTFTFKGQQGTNTLSSATTGISVTFAPAVPTNAAFTGTTNVLTWDVMSGATSYDVRYTVNGGTQATAHVTAATYTVAAATTAGDVVVASVRANNAGGNSGYCSNVTVTLA